MSDMNDTTGKSDTSEPAPTPDSDDPEVDALQALCERLDGFGVDLSVEKLDGFITALVCGPRTLMPSEWIEALCGDAFERAHGDPQSLEEATGALLARWNTVAEQLHPDRLLEEEQQLRVSPLLMYWDDEARAKLVAEGLMDEDGARGLQPGAEWARGFAEAIDIFQDDWSDAGLNRDETEALGQCLRDVFFLAVPPDSPRYAALLRDRGYPSDLSRDDLIDVACFAVQDLRLLWIERQVRPSPRRVEARPGRNDPCPCGSGRKFKKCHGAVGP